MAITLERKTAELQAQLHQVELEHYLMEQKILACERMAKPADDAKATEKAAYAALQAELSGYRSRQLYLEPFIAQYTGELEALAQ